MKKKQILILVIIKAVVFCLSVNAQNLRSVSCSGHNIEMQFSFTVNKSLFASNQMTAGVQDDQSLSQLSGKINGCSSTLFLARFYSKSLFALRVGAGSENLSYEISYHKEINSANSKEVKTQNYSAIRRDLLLNIGVEKHFHLTQNWTASAGVEVPMSLLGQAKSDHEFITEYTNRKGFMGLGIIGGMQFRIAQVFTVGAEFESMTMKTSYSFLNENEGTDHLSFQKTSMNIKLSAGFVF